MINDPLTVNSTLPGAKAENSRAAAMDRLRQIKISVWLVTSFLLLVIAGIVVLFIANEKRHLSDQAMVMSSNLARAFEEHIARTAQSVDQQIIFVRNQYEGHDGDLHELDRLIQKLTANNALIAQVALIDPRGMMLYTNLQPPGQGPSAPVDLSDREHFRVHLADASDFLFISRPVLGRVSQRETLQFTRKFLWPDGSFGGVIVFSVATSYLSDFYQSINIGEHGAIKVIGWDGAVRAQASTASNRVGVDVYDLTLLEKARNQPSGSYRFTPGDQYHNYLVSYRKLHDVPLIVAVASSDEDFLAPLKGTITWLGSFSLALGATLIVIAAFFGRQLRDQQMLNAELGGIENALRKSELQHRSVVEQVKEVIFQTDKEGRWLFLNPAWTEITGFPVDDSLGKIFLDFVHPVDRARNMELFQPLLERKKPFCRHEARYLTKSGDYRWIEVFARVTENEDGEITGTAGTLYDITSQKQVHQELVVAKKVAERAGRARSQFLAIMSHEIRTPLNGIVGATDLLLDCRLDAEAGRFAQMVRSSADHLLQIINDILDFSKLDTGKLELEEVAFNVCETIDSVVELLQPHAEGKNIALEIVNEMDPSYCVAGDPGRIRQVLFNLIDNAIKFTQHGRVQVHSQMSDSGSDFVVLTCEIRDTGMGIPEDVIPNLFKDFTQVDATISRRFGGTGLGLAICKKLVTIMGGSVHVTSELGKGSVFACTFRLSKTAHPAAVGAAAVTARSPQALSFSDATAPAAPDGARAERQLRVLLAEDNPTNQLIATAMLEKLGHHVNAVGNGLEAVEAIRSLPYDLILMDVQMPEMDGLAATRAIRAMPAPKGKIPIIAFTANAFPEDQERCLAAGSTSFLAKPIKQDKLAAAIADVFDARRFTPRATADCVVPAAQACLDQDAFEDLADTIGMQKMPGLISRFLSDTQNHIAQMEQAAQELDRTTVRSHAHRLKSSAAMVGASELSTAMAELEAEIQRLDELQLKQSVAGIARSFKAIRPLLQEAVMEYRG